MSGARCRLASPIFWQVLGEFGREIRLARAKFGVQGRGLRNRRSEVRILSGALQRNGSREPISRRTEISTRVLGGNKWGSRRALARAVLASAIDPRSAVPSGRLSPGGELSSPPSRRQTARVRLGRRVAAFIAVRPRAHRRPRRLSVGVARGIGLRGCVWSRARCW